MVSLHVENLLQDITTYTVGILATISLGSNNIRWHTQHDERIVEYDLIALTGQVKT
jgi:hypothetical protein